MRSQWPGQSQREPRGSDDGNTQTMLIIRQYQSYFLKLKTYGPRVYLCHILKPPSQAPVMTESLPSALMVTVQYGARRVGNHISERSFISDASPPSPQADQRDCFYFSELDSAENRGQYNSAVASVLGHRPAPPGLRGSIAKLMQAQRGIECGRLIEPCRGRENTTPSAAARACGPHAAGIAG